MMMKGGVKYGLDAVGGEGGALLVKVLSEEGILVNYGVLGGLTLEVDLSALLFKVLYSPFTSLLSPLLIVRAFKKKKKREKSNIISHLQ